MASIKELRQRAKELQAFVEQRRKELSRLQQLHDDPLTPITHKISLRTELNKFSELIAMAEEELHGCEAEITKQVSELKKVREEQLKLFSKTRGEAEAAYHAVVEEIDTLLRKIDMAENLCWNAVHIWQGLSELSLQVSEPVGEPLTFNETKLRKLHELKKFIEAERQWGYLL